MQSNFFWLGIRYVFQLPCYSFISYTDIYGLFFCADQLVENDKMRNANREALTALRKRARTTKTSVPSPFDVIMKEMEGTSGKQLVKEICPTCGNHDPKEHTWLMFPGSDIFARVPFHVTHTILDKGTTTFSYLDSVHFVH
jgi:hypothetical protein